MVFFFVAAAAGGSGFRPACFRASASLIPSSMSCFAFSFIRSFLPIFFFLVFAVPGAVATWPPSSFIGGIGRVKRFSSLGNVAAFSTYKTTKVTT